MKKSECGTLEHIRLSYLVDRGESGLRVGWRQVIRDAWWGIVVWVVTCLVFLFVGGPEWIVLPVGVWILLFVLTTLVRLFRGHKMKCSLMYGVHFPFQLGEQV